MESPVECRKAPRRRLRTLTFGLLTPFYFIRAGSFVSVPALIAAPLAFVVLLGAKMATKFAGVFPATWAFKSPRREAMYTTLLMSTGLTFGTISSVFGLSSHHHAGAVFPAGGRRRRQRRRADADRQRLLPPAPPAAGSAGSRARSDDRSRPVGAADIERCRPFPACPNQENLERSLPSEPSDAIALSGRDGVRSIRHGGSIGVRWGDRDGEP